MMNNIKRYSLLYSAFFVYSFVAVFAKTAAMQDSLIKMLLFIGVEFAFLGIYAFIWQQALKHFSLVVAMSSKGVTVIIALFWAVIIFGESISVQNIIGAMMIIVGICVVSMDD